MGFEAMGISTRLLWSKLPTQDPFFTTTMAAPDAKTVQTVVNYFYDGQKEGPILTDSKLCRSIKGLECENPLGPNALSVGEPVKVWMQFFVPKGASYDDIFIEYKYNNSPRHLTAHKVEGSIRYRIVDTYAPDKSGDWTITIKRGSTNLKSFKIKVQKK